MLTRHARDNRPATDARLASLLDAAAAPAEPGPAPGEQAALAAFRASSVRPPGWRSQMRPTPLKALAAAAVSAGLLLTGGVAAANAGMLPGAAQQAAHDALVKVGVQVPGPDEHSADHADTRGHSGEAPAGEAGGTDPESANSHGKVVSELAKSTDGGPEKGKAISEMASSNGQAHRHQPAPATEQSASSADHAQAPEAAKPAEGDAGQSVGHARVPTPNGGGTGTADDASADNGGGASTNGTANAQERSGERSTLGSGNAEERSGGPSTLGSGNAPSNR